MEIVAFWSILAIGFVIAILIKIKDILVFKNRIFAKASVATVLIPLVRGHIKEGTTIRIVGNDGENLCNESYCLWRNAIVDWMKKFNCKIEYIFVNPNDQTVQSVKNIITEMKQTKSSEVFYPYKIDSEKIKNNKEYLEIVEMIKTFHFVVFDNPKQIWLESYHEEGSLTAYDCEYIPPALASNDIRFNILKEKFESIKKNATVLIQ